MTARDAISPLMRHAGIEAERMVDGDSHLLEALPLLLEAPGRMLAVTGDAGPEGVIDSDAMLEALGRLIALRYDCSVIELLCAPGDYSASHLARAVEDADVHLVDLLSAPAENGNLLVTIRVRCEDPEPVVHSLERYGYNVVASYGHGNVPQVASAERLLALQAMINV